MENNFEPGHEELTNAEKKEMKKEVKEKRKEEEKNQMKVDAIALSEVTKEEKVTDFFDKISFLSLDDDDK